MPADTRPRRPLTQRGGAIETAGDPELARLLADALSPSESDDIFDFTHGFHTYPARMHPVLARALLAKLAGRNDVVLDPFCGSGTVLVEARLSGCRAQGVDLNPLALRIAEVTCSAPNRSERGVLMRITREVAEASEARVRARERVSKMLSPRERSYYEPHTLLELIGLWEEIDRVQLETAKRALQIVFSALVVKFSQQRADTSEEQVKKRIRKGLPTEFFVRKTEELCRRWEALEAALPARAPEARLALGDARQLENTLGPNFLADLILTSPPYGGTYDYVEQHARRNAWLRLDDRALREHEIGSRRHLSEDPRGRARWDRELADVLQSMSAVLAPRGRIVLWLGDAEIAGERVPAPQQLHKLAPRAGLSLVASASQQRPDFRGGSPRKEHLLLLARS